MSPSELLPNPPIDTATKRKRWRALVGPTRFGQKLRRIGFLGSARRLMKKNLASAPGTAVNDMPSDFTVERLWTGPGPGTDTADGV